ncbi:MAG: ComEA family DNA-binding protein, partial [Lachnospiraceae bacterium]|nr:ComEA family DNA-binding protein [Lachnospiraceae bacterium]
NTLYVYICGAVRRSGVYILPAGSRITDAVKAAGGLLPDADETAVNQAALLTDGEQITVPHTGEQTAVRIAGQTSSAGTADAAGKININTADAGTLQQLSGIGASRAADIIAYRDMHGAFQSIEEIMNVSGIKTALFEKIRDRICI